MQWMLNGSNLKTTVWGLSLALALIGITSANAEEEKNAASFDNGDRLVVSYHWKIEHRGKSPIDIFVHQLGTAEGRKLLAAAATSLGLDPTLATIVTANIHLPHLDAGATDNKGLLAAPNGMTICKAGHGYMETSHASWSSSVVRNKAQDGLAFYTSVGTSPGQTHRIEGNFYVEYVKPIDDWQKKFGCVPDKTIAWDLHN